MLKFKKNGSVKAVLKDEASEPEGIVYIEDSTLPDDIAISPDADPLEEQEFDGQLEEPSEL